MRKNHPVQVLFGDILKRVFESLNSYRKFLLLFRFPNFAIYTREAFLSFTFNSEICSQFNKCLKLRLEMKHHLGGKV